MQQLPYLYGMIHYEVFPETENFFSYLAFLTDFPCMEIIVAGSQCSLVVEELRGNTQAGKTTRGIPIETEQIEEAKPHIVLREPDAAYIEAVTIQASAM